MLSCSAASKHTAIDERHIYVHTLRSDRVMRPLSRLLDVRCSDPNPAIFPRSTVGAAAAAASVAITALAASSPFSTSALKAALYVGDLSKAKRSTAKGASETPNTKLHHCKFGTHKSIVE